MKSGPGGREGGVLGLEEVRRQPFLSACLFRKTPSVPLLLALFVKR